MQCIFLANCGVLLRLPEASIAVDAPNGLHTLFDPFPEEELERMALGEAPYEHLKGFLFTHRHSDHYDKKRLRAVLERRPELESFSPSGATAERGELHADPFHIRYETISHSGAEFSEVYHRVYLIEAAGKSVYVTGDADWAPEGHLSVLGDCRPDLAVWNSNVVTHPESRALLSLAKKNLIVHLPLHSEDALGVGRKCRSVWARIGEELPNVTLAEHEGMTIEV